MLLYRHHNTEVQKTELKTAKYKLPILPDAKYIARNTGLCFEKAETVRCKKNDMR
jgi:hypothetical protein